MNFKQYLEENSDFDYEEFEDSYDSDGDYIEDLDNEDDQFAVYTDEDEELTFEASDDYCEDCQKEECECDDAGVVGGKAKLVNERLKKVKVIRKGKKQIKWKSDREGYKIVRDGNRAKEVKMTPQERMKRSKQQKRGARKRKRTSKTAVRNRARSLKRRTF